MATVNLTGQTVTAGVPGNASLAYSAHPRTFMAWNKVDMGANAVATGDVVQCLAIKANWLVYNVYVKVVEAMGLTATATVGDAGSAAGWDASTNLNAAAGTITKGANGTDARVLDDGYLYSTADTVDLTVTITSGPATAGIVIVGALVVDLSFTA